MLPWSREAHRKVVYARLLLLGCISLSVKCVLTTSHITQLIGRGLPNYGPIYGQLVHSETRLNSPEHYLISSREQMFWSSRQRHLMLLLPWGHLLPSPWTFQKCLAALTSRTPSIIGLRVHHNYWMPVYLFLVLWEMFALTFYIFSMIL